MKLLNYIKSKIYLTLGFILIATFCVSCGIYKPVDARKVSPNADERVKKNLEEGRGFTLMGGNKNSGGTNYSFASSNPMWRATLEILDFIPLSNIDYSGGIIITDWYNDGTAGDEAIKIKTVPLLVAIIANSGTTLRRCEISLFKKYLSKPIKIQGNIANASISGFIINLAPNTGGKKFKKDREIKIFVVFIFLVFRKINKPNNPIKYKIKFPI